MTRRSGPTPRRSGTRRRVRARRSCCVGCCASHCCIFCCWAVCCSPYSVAAALMPARPTGRSWLAAADIDRLAAAFSRTWNRPPSRTSCRRRSRTTSARRCSIARRSQLGLDKDDSIIRRRLRQKMEFLFEDTVAPPQETELRAYLQSHSEQVPHRTTDLASARSLSAPAAETATEPDARRILANLATDAPGGSGRGGSAAAGRHVQPDAARSDRCPVRRRLR